ncbi:MAG TPA: ABC transporter permease [Acidimicrobiales bacterium]|nr:ABC transporter permease [Acidimicrobiales bacterium]
MPDGRAIVSQAPGELLAADAGSEAVLVLETVPAQADTGARRGKGLGVTFWVCLVWVSLMILLAVLASVLPFKAPNAQDYSAVNVGPSLHHLLGTDDLGRDLLSRVIFGSRVSLVIGFAPIAIGLVIGGALGLLAGYRSGATDTVLNAVSFVILAFPALLAIMVIETFWKPVSLLKLTLMFAFVGAPQLFRVIRATTISFASREFVVAARATGAKTSRILLRELLPNILPAAVSFALIGVAIAIVLEGSLAFLGLSIGLPTSSLGNIINDGVNSNNLSLNPYIALWPSLYIFLLLTALNLMADRLRSYFDLREVKL